MEKTAGEMSKLSPREYLEWRKEWFENGIRRRDSLLEKYPHLADREDDQGLPGEQYKAWQTITTFKNAETELQEINEKLGS